MAKLIPSAQYTLTVRLEYPHRTGELAKIANVIASLGAAIEAIDFIEIHRGKGLRDYSLECTSVDHAKTVISKLKELDGVTVRSVSDDTFLKHLGGKLEVQSTVELKTRSDLSMAYTPGVARVCMAIHEDPLASFNLTIRKNCVAIVSDGSAVLGLGSIGPRAAMPVMEGKAILLKEFAGVDAFPLCITSGDVDSIIQFCREIEPTFGAINLEDIAAPKCFEVERVLEEELEIPVFHDDQHGTAVVVLAAAINALKIVGKAAQNMKLVVSGAGAAGVACTKTLVHYGFSNVIVCDSRGAIHKGRDLGANVGKQWLAENTNPDGFEGSLKEAVKGADFFLGVSRENVLTRDDVAAMNKDPIVFACSNPNPEVPPEEVEGIAKIIATGRSDYPNQINNVLAFPGIFRGALDTRATSINQEMKQAAALAIASFIADDDLLPEHFLPSIFDRKVTKNVAAAVAKAAHHSGVARRMPKLFRAFQR